MSDEDFDVLGTVAAATGLNEGEAGVLRVLACLTRQGRQPTNVVARTARLPVPLAAAVLNELRGHGIVDGERPAGLTDAGRKLTAALALPANAPAVAGLAERRPLPPQLERVVDELAALMEQSSLEVDVTLDQSFATAETKVRRVLAMYAAGSLPTPRLLAIGDDDLISVAVDRVQSALGMQLAGDITVVDVSEPVLGAIDAAMDRSTPLTLVRHDVREPLPLDVAGRATVAMTDPPYTIEGARLFLSRALEGLRPGPGWDVYLHFGTKPPAVAQEMQQVFNELGLVVRSVVPGFNEYLGAGIIGGTSDAWRLEVATSPAPLGVQEPAPIYGGPLYTADLRRRSRQYRCRGCGALVLVGPTESIGTVGELKRDGCAECGGHVFVPGRLAATPAPATPLAPVAEPAPASEQPSPREAPSPESRQSDS